ncbi:MAG TPA: HAMP domain-containing sensor histidine kinase [Gaiellaceae bacterium]|nr:HAMP domain-containing sensor histidine kinase [Gaiellaceae bacterium]
MKSLFRRRAEVPDEQARLQIEAERSRILVEESREAVVILDAQRRVIAASRRARHGLEGVAVGEPFPEQLLEASGGRDPLEIPYQVNGHRESLVYLGTPGDLAAYQELRAGFTAAVSHELRTPLARLMVLLDGFGLQGADPVALARQARDEVEQIGELIDDVLFLSELEGGRAVVSLGSTPALPVLEEVVRARAERAANAGIELRVECPADFELPLRPRMLETMAANLADNALRYAGVGASFTLRARREGNSLVLSGTDNGHGVTEEDLPRLFERFFRSDRARSSHGTGLGLAIVKHIVTAAGGTAEARAAHGGGLEIRCSFPSSLL